MQNANFQVGMVVGNADSAVWSQVAVRPLDLRYLAVLTKIEAPFEGELLSLPQIGTELIESLKVRLPEAHNQEELKQLISSCVEGMDIELKVSVGAMLFEKGKLYTVTVGEVEVYIAREGKVGRIAPSGAAVAGVTQASDFYTLTTVEVPSGVGINKWKEIMMARQAGVEQLAVEVHGKNNNGACATVAVGLAGEETADKSKLELKQAKEFFIRLWQRPLAIKQEQLKLNAWVGAGFTLLLLLGVGIGIVRRTQVVKEKAYENMVSVVTQRVNEARSVGDLNPERAKYLLKSASDEVQIYKEKNKEEKYQEEANRLMAEVASSEVEIFKKEEVITNTFVETKIFSSSFDPEKMVVNEKGSVLLFETAFADVWGVSLADKSSYKVSPSEVKAIKELVSYKSKLYILNEEGVFSTEEKKGTTKKEIEKDDLWSNPRFLDQYAGNIYVLDSGQGEIWKYPVLTDGFGARRRWLAPGIELDLSNVSDMAVDGDIWLITRTGKLERYRRGVPIVFPMEGFPYAEQGKLSLPSSIYLTEGKVYVAENGAKRIVVIDKESGKYESQYVSEELSKTRAMVVWEGKCYVLVDGKIIWFEL